MDLSLSPTENLTRRVYYVICSLVSTLARQFNTRRCLSVVPDDKQEQVSPPVTASKHLTPQVPPTTVRELEMVPDTKIVDSNLPTVKETHNTCTYDSRYLLCV